MSCMYTIPVPRTGNWKTCSGQCQLYVEGGRLITWIFLVYPLRSGLRLILIKFPNVLFFSSKSLPGQFYVVDAVVLHVPEGVSVVIPPAVPWLFAYCPPPSPRGYYLMPFCDHIILGFEAHICSGLDNKEYNETYLNIYCMMNRIQLRWSYILHIVYILILQLTLVPVLSDNTWPSPDVGQVSRQLNGWHRWGRKRRINKIWKKQFLITRYT